MVIDLERNSRNTSASSGNSLEYDDVEMTCTKIDERENIIAPAYDEVSEATQLLGEGLTAKVY